jgi:Glycosyl transferase family 2/Glycosyl transferases group 1/Methyltransferase domain
MAPSTQSTAQPASQKAQPPAAPTIAPPDLIYDTSENDYRPSWSSPGRYINAEHERIFETTKDLAGWQDPPDSEKLYEIAYHTGAVILDVGSFAGRSAVVQLRGALAAHKERHAPEPQLYTLDTDPGAIWRTRNTLRDENLIDWALLFHGSLADFHRDLPVVPTMVFLDADHRYESVWSDLRLLGTMLSPHTPVLCHDYLGIVGVRQAVDEWVGRGFYKPMGLFAGSILLQTTAKISAGEAKGLGRDQFVRTSKALLGRYFGRDPITERKSPHEPVRDLTRDARDELSPLTHFARKSYRAFWPYSAVDSSPLPDAMPDGRPWPKISVVTPTFNQGGYIEQTMLSVANQNYPNIEHLVIDGGSTDDTLNVLNRFDLDGVVSEKDKGQSDAINKGFARATGEILTWVNSDDMLASGALAAAAMALTGTDGYQCADGRRGADFVTGICRIFNNDWPPPRFAHACMTSVPQGDMPLAELLDLERNWLAGRFWWQPDCLFTRDLWVRAGGHVRLDWYYSMDYELWLRMAEAGARVRAIGRPICLYRAHEEQKTAEADGGGFRGELPRAAQDFCDTRGLTRPTRPAKPHRSLRVALLSDIGFQFGAGIAHRRIAAGFAGAGHEVFPFALSRSNNDAIEIDTRDVVGSIAACEPDLVLVGNLHGAGIDPVRATDLLGAVAERFETAFVMHDLWLLSGRCAYPGECERFASGCDGSCSCPGGYPELDAEQIERAWNAKRRVLALSENLTLLANSRWTLGQARHALRLMDEPPAMDWITYGLDTEVFRPRDKQASRETLGLDENKFIIMTSASSLDDERKGLGLLREALKMLDLPDIQVIAPGWKAPGDPEPIAGMRAMGYLQDEAALARMYAAADVFVSPAIDEAFGQVYVEAAACGVPSIGFAVGGVPEAVGEGVGGLLAHEVSAESLAQCIGQLYEDAQLRRDLGQWGRLRVESDFSLAAAHHRMHEALTATGVADRIGLHCKIDLTNAKRVPEPTLIRSAGSNDGRAGACSVVEGLGPFEGPVPTRSLGRFRWAAPVCVLEFWSERAGKADLVIGCRNDRPGQRVRVVANTGTISKPDQDAGESRRTGAAVDVGETDVPLCTDRDHMLRFRLHVRKGVNRIELHHWKWAQIPAANGTTARKLANRITSLNLIPR